jgi:hypothetical protein
MFNKSKRLSELKSIAKSNGGKCLSKKYINAKTKLSFKCSCGHVWQTLPDNIMRGKWCPACRGKRISKSKTKYDLEAYKKLAKSWGVKLLSDEYKGTKNFKYDWECLVCKHQWTSTPNQSKRKTWCPKCAGIYKDLDSLKDIARNNGGKLLDKKYKGMSSKYSWQCGKCSHKWRSIASSAAKGHWCPVCAVATVSDKNKTQYSTLKAKSKELGLKMMFSKTEYGSPSRKHCFECRSCRREISSTPKRIMNGFGCNFCSKGLAERICRQFFEQVFKEKFPPSYPKWLVSPRGTQLELDGYNDSLGLAFEHHGIQHYKVGYYTKNKTELANRKKTDKRKKSLCKRNGVLLIEIPALFQITKIDDLEKFILNELKKNKYSIPKFETINYSKAYVKNDYINEYKTLLKQKKMILLEDKWLGWNGAHLHRCKVCKNEWKAAPSNVKLGRGCKVCAYKRKRGGVTTLEEAKELAKSKGGRCLSKRVLNAQIDLKWKCSEGHIWYAPYNRVKFSSWCPECGGSKRLTIDHFKKIAKSKNGKCHSSNYKNSQSILEFSCKAGHNFKRRAAEIRRGRWCQECSRLVKNRNQMTDVSPIIKKKGGKYLGFEKGENGRYYHEIECTNGHTWKIMTSNLTRGKWCPICAGKKKK